MGDVHTIAAYSLVATAPSPATSGTSLVVTAGEGARYPTGSFYAVVWPTGSAQPAWGAGTATGGNFEIVRATIATDTMTITRAQLGTSARTVVVGDQIAQVMLPTDLTTAVPTVVAVTAEFSSTGVPTASLPTGHTTNDILVLVIQSANEGQVTAPATYTNLGPQNGIGSTAAGANRLSIFWKRDGGSEVAPTIPDTGDHTYGFMFAIRGCPTVGDPFHLLGNNFKTATSTAGSGPVGTTVIDNCLVIDIFAESVDNATGQATSPANAGLTNFTSQFNDGTTDGIGGGIYMSSGTRATAGDIVATTLTWSNTSVDLATRIAFVPSNTSQITSSPHPTEVQVFIGSPLTPNDIWVKATGARKVLVQAIGGGGAGSSGHTATTPSGGGGGGGGHYTERSFNANDLAATVTVQAGNGGAATAVAVDQPGSAGNNSIFNVGSPMLTAVAGGGATAAASGNGGDGGQGGGVTTPGVGAVATRAGGELGTLGGNGSTTGVGGSPGDRGGGGGASGTTAANTTVIAGASAMGGGGGGAGSNTGALTGGGAGGQGAASGTTPSANGGASTVLPYGGGGACGGNATTAPGGAGGFPGGGGGGGGGNNAATQGGAGGHGVVVVTTYF